MKIKVILRSDGSTIEIDEADFNESLHKKIRTLGDMSADEFADASARATATALAEALDGLGAGKIDRSKVTKPGEEKRVEKAEPFTCRAGHRIDAETVAYGESIHGRPVIERRYDTLPANERAVRSFEGDLQIQRYFRALHRKDWESMESVLRESLGWDAVRATNPQSTTNAEGGYLAPAPLSSYLAELRSKFERIMPRSMVLTSESQTLSVTTATDEGAVVAVTENAAPTDDDHVFGTVAMSKKKAGRLTYVSNELLSDQLGAFSIVNIVANATARKLGAYWDGEFATGTYITDDIEGSAISEVATTLNVLTRRELTRVINAVGTEWRDGGGLTMMGNSSITDWITNLEDSNGRPIYQPATQATMPLSDIGGGGVAGVIEGMAYIEVPFAANIVVVGRLSEGYGVLMDGGVRVDTDASVGFAADQIAIRIMERRDGAVLQAAAFKKSETLTES